MNNIERWIPGVNEKRPAEFTYKSVNNIWYKSEEEYFKYMGAK